jgi:type I restriction enzyme S subunit
MNNESFKHNWPIVKFGDVVQNVNLVVRNIAESGIDRIVGLEHVDSENLHIKRWDSPENGTSFTRKFIPGQTLFGKRRAYQRKVAFAEFEGICSSDILTFQSKDPKVLLPELLPFICQTDAFFEHALGTSAGSLSPRTNWSALSEFEFHLPSIEEQKRIAEILWAADETINQYSLVLEKLRKVLHSYLTEITSFNPKRKWQKNKLISCFEIVSGQVNPKNEPYCSMPLVAPNHIEQGTGMVISLETAKEQNAISGKYLFKSGDVVYSKIRPNLKKAFISTFDGLCSADMYALRPKTDKIISRFLLAVLLSNHFTTFALSRCTRTGIPKLNRQELAEYEIQIPSIEEQHTICENIIKIDKAECNLINHLSKLSVLKKDVFFTTNNMLKFKR